jgi:hypothetical protein
MKAILTGGWILFTIFAGVQLYQGNYVMALADAAIAALCFYNIKDEGDPQE